MMDIDLDSFYVCTEASPRCFVLYKGIQLDRDQLQRIRKDVDEGRMEPGGGIPGANYIPPETGALTTVLPPFPEWFNDQCRRELMLAGDAATGGGETEEDRRVNDGGGGGRIEGGGERSGGGGGGREFDPSGRIQLICHTDAARENERMKLILKNQLEYYFSRENLAQDRYLKCQMDADGFVAISTVAGFRKVVALTDNYDLIVQTLRESRKVEVDDAGERVRPISQRCTIILREMGEKTEEEVKSMLAGGPPYKSLRTYGNNDEWYVVYCNEETTKSAYLHIQQLKPSICARIKSGPPPDQQLFVQPPSDEVLSIEGGGGMAAAAAAGGGGPIDARDLGQVLCSMGFVPRATYRPETTVVKVVESSDGMGVQPSSLLHSPIPHDYSFMNGGGGAAMMGGGYGNGGGGGYRRGRGNSSDQSRTFNGRDGGGISSSSYRTQGRREQGAAPSGAGGQSAPPFAPRSNGSRGALNGGSLTVVTGKPIRGGEKRWTSRNGTGNGAAAGAAPDLLQASFPLPAVAAAGPSTSSAISTPFNSSWGSSSGAGRGAGSDSRSNGAAAAATSTAATAADRGGTATSNSTVNESGSVAQSCSLELPFEFEEQSFPSLHTSPKPDTDDEQPVKQKLSFSSVAAGRKEEKKKERKSFAQCLKN